MASLVVDQREVQRRGGICAKVPTACIVADLLKEAGIEARNLLVFDITYGQGRFWAKIRPRVLIGADVAVLEWVVEPDIFIKKPAWQSWRLVKQLGIRVDLVAVDPPWSDRGSSLRHHFGIDRALGGPKPILEAAACAARELRAQYLLVHYKTRYVPQGFSVVAEMEWLPVTRYIDYSKAKPTTWWGLLRRG